MFGYFYFSELQGFNINLIISKPSEIYLVSL